MKREVIVRIEDSFMEGSTKLFIAIRENGRIYAAQPLVFKLVEPGEIREATATFHQDENFVDALGAELRRVGIIEAANSETISAVRDHLKDMRTLVFERKESSGR